MSRPQVTGDEEHERVHERVAAVDVAKDSGMVCTPHPAPVPSRCPAQHLRPGPGVPAPGPKAGRRRSPSRWQGSGKLALPGQAR